LLTRLRPRLLGCTNFSMFQSTTACSDRSSGQTFPGVVSGVQHRLSGTRCHIQFYVCFQIQTLFLFTQAFPEHRSDLPPAPLKLRPYGAIQIRLLFFTLIISSLRMVPVFCCDLFDMQTASRIHSVSLADWSSSRSPSPNDRILTSID